MIIISKTQAHSAFEKACHLGAEQLLQLHDFQTIMQFYVTLKGNPHTGTEFGTEQKAYEGRYEAATPLNIKMGAIGFYTGYIGHPNGENALFETGASDYYAGKGFTMPDQSGQVSLVQSVLDVLRI